MAARPKTAPEWPKIGQNGLGETLKSYSCASQPPRARGLLASVHVNERYVRMMSELRDALDARLNLGLKTDARVDSAGTLHGRIFMENPNFGAEFTLVRVTDTESEEEGEECEVSVRSQFLPKVNGLSRYFPFTSSNRTLREVDRITKETVSRCLGKSVSVAVDNTVGIEAAYLVGALGVLGALFGSIYGLLITLTSAGSLYGGVVGGAVGAGAMVTLIFTSVD